MDPFLGGMLTAHKSERSKNRYPVKLKRVYIRTDPSFNPFPPLTKCIVV